MRFTRRTYREAFRRAHRLALENITNPHIWAHHHRASWLIFQRARRKGIPIR